MIYRIPTDVGVEAHVSTNSRFEDAANFPEPSKAPDRKRQTKARRAA
jgi:hypothetical protein